MISPPPQKRSVLERVFERLEFKRCPQGLNVMAEELLWMGEKDITHDKLWNAVRAEMSKSHPRLRFVAEGVYWFSDRNIPVGWSLFGDRRMLPCFYRVYPPAISWEDLDRPENILPPPTGVYAYLPERRERT